MTVTGQYCEMKHRNSACSAACIEYVHNIATMKKKRIKVTRGIFVSKKRITLLKYKAM